MSIDYAPYVYADSGDDITHLVSQDDIVARGEDARTLCGDHGTADLSLGDETESGATATCVACLDLLDEEPPTYRIVRFHFQSEREVIDAGLTLAEAQAHCNRDDTHGDGWFDGYERED